jgi:LacI family transcriptional regulator
MLALTHGKDERELTLLQAYSNFCDGIIFLKDPVKDSLLFLENRKLPFVIADSQMDLKNSIRIDRQSGVEEALLQLHDLYDDFLFLTLNENETEDRYSAFKNILETLGKRYKSLLYEEVEREGDTGEWDMKIETLKPKTLLICFNDRIAASVLRTAYKQGVSVPEGIGIVGFDNDDFTKYTHKKISTITQSVNQLASITVDCLLKMKNGEAFTQPTFIQTKFIPRETTLTHSDS